ncbi:hypothetical protein ACFSMW_14770 [Virgibacillus halophilus]|uniref:Uncharacterized protein n=1 Tax=Tigheibacillus halophilus TaxID=361280 RepID=A0ABU5CDC0_9BACI|nr:hypothetical protein [Virgibacillus halophilus]
MRETIQEQYNVLLPKWVFKPENEKEQTSLAMYYMQSYPHYDVLFIKNGFAMCVRRQTEVGTK